MLQQRLFPLLICAFISLGLILGGCAGEAALTLRTDPGPLANRLNLPKLQSVRWVAVSPVHDTGWIPPKIEFYYVYAYIDFDDGGWADLEKTAGPSTPGSISLPERVATLLLPAVAAKEFTKENDTFEARGPSFNTSTLAAQPRNKVAAAIRIGSALVVQMTAR
jgi:hypothetical protein